jgi:hypothetical protein
MDNFEFLPLEDFLYKKSEDEPLTIKEQIDRLKRDYPAFSEEMIKVLLGVHTEEDLKAIENQRRQIKTLIDEYENRQNQEPEISQTNQTFVGQVDDLEPFTYNYPDDFKNDNEEVKEFFNLDK